MKLAFQITTVLIILIIVPLMAFLSVFYFRAYKAVEMQYYETKDQEVEDLVKRLTDQTHNYRADLQFLASTASLQALVNTDTNTEKAEFLSSVQHDFLSMARLHDEYFQIRYIDAAGQEVVRIDQIGDEPHIVSDDKLQNKKDRYYFQDAMANDLNAVYISELDLNIENGKLENRGSETNPEYVPVVRIAQIVQNDKGENQGILIVNIYADAILRALRDSSTDDSQYYLTNKDGYFLYHPESKKTFTFQKATEPYVIADEFPQLSQVPDAREAFTYDTYHIFQKPINIFARRGDPVTQTSIENVWTLIRKTDSSQIQSDARQVIARVAMYGIVIILLTAVTGYLFVRSILSPLRDLKEGTAIIASGDLDYRIKEDGNNEISELAMNFNHLASRLKKSHESVESTIRDRTERLSKLNSILIGREIKMAEIKKQIQELKKKYEK